MYHLPDACFHNKSSIKRTLAHGILDIVNEWKIAGMLKTLLLRHG